MSLPHQARPTDALFRRSPAFHRFGPSRLRRSGLRPPPHPLRAPVPSFARIRPSRLHTPPPRRAARARRETTATRRPR